MKNMIKKLFTKEKKSSMELWAEREVAIACKNEREETTEDDCFFDYGCACYESALKAFKSLLGDGHSGYSIGVTKHILNRLIDGSPLTQIEDTPDIWNDITYNAGEYITYQCRRMSALFKDVYPDGRVKYHSVDSCTCVDINNGSTYSSGLVSRIYHEMFPITMPYMPTKPAKVYCEDILTDKRHGDFDTMAIFYIVKNDSEKIEVNRFFKENGHDWEEINADEYAKRKELAASIE